MSKKRVLIVCPNTWERDQLIGGSFATRHEYEFETFGEDSEGAPASFDALAFVEAAVERFREAGLDGVASSSDYPGCLVAAAIAQELGLPGADPAALLTCSHKYYSRLAQREVVPEATPGFALVVPGDDVGALGLSYPLFVKPVKSWFSVFARRVENAEELAAFLAQPRLHRFLEQFTRPFNQLVARYARLPIDASRMLAEECLTGDQVTVEGYVLEGKVRVIGITDSVMHPGTISFARFDCPSRLPAGVQARIRDVVERAIRGIGLDRTLFNIELFYDAARGGVHIIEVNPRMVGQFADLLEKVDGVNTFEILLKLATGQTPSFADRRGAYGAAASFPLRIFNDQRLTRVASRDEIADVKRRHPGALVKSYLEVGQRGSDLGDDQNDLESYLYGMINLGAADHAGLLSAFDDARGRLGFAFE